MRVEQQQIGSVDVFTPVGALVDQEAGSFLKLLLERAESDNPRVVVSMQDVPYMDSAAVEGLLAVTDGLMDRAMNLKLARVQSACREILELTGVSGRFSFFQDVQDAVRSFL